jgi:phosphoenolpyruvate carboxykinase (GTP)
MDPESLEILKTKLADEDRKKLMKIDNHMLHQFIATYVELCNPSKVNIFTDSEEDLRRTRETAIANKEEVRLSMENHTVHFDGYHDQARDKEGTRFLLPPDIDLGPAINAMDRDEGLSEIREIMADIMAGREMHIKFFCLGPVNSQFSIPCVQITDSAYVAHSEDLLYRQGYREFIRQGREAGFWKFVHSEGELEEAGLGLLVSKNIDKRRIYIDLQDEIIYSANTQYAGNSLGLKKLAMRLGINKGSKEGWLCEHMLIMGVQGAEGRVSYFTGAFPSMCGKTSTAMIEHETIVGDDIAFLRIVGNDVKAVNAESGIFGIIDGINDVDDALQWKALNDPRAEIIFSNLLVYDGGKIFWNGKPGDPPESGVNYSGQWYKGKKDPGGKEITPSHKNARFTLRLDILDNIDPRFHDPGGVEVKGFIYGGRDSDIWVPVEEAFDWIHGIITMGAALESETTAATLENEGIRAFNPMSILDFLSIPIGKYIQNNIDFGKKVQNPPRIFSVNYFLLGSDGNWLSHKNDKHVWLKWMDLKVNNEADAIRTPTGLIPKYETLKDLFKVTLESDYPREDYIEQFTIRVPENLAKIDRLMNIYRTRVLDTPQIVFEVLEKQRERLEAARGIYGDYISPYQL